ncbi:MAG: hypothetical protein ACOCRX_04770 [Candidatus Woesearchaeota archaeon]
MWRLIEDFKKPKYYIVIHQKTRKKKKVFFHNQDEVDEYLEGLNK